MIRIILSWKLKTLNYNARFIELASEINTSMPFYVIDKITAALNNQERAVRGSRILIMGVAYKANVDDVRESPALDIISLLRQRGAEVAYHDPHVPQIQLDSDLRLQSKDLSGQLLKDAHCVVIVTDHSVFDWKRSRGTAMPSSTLATSTATAMAGILSACDAATTPVVAAVVPRQSM